MTDGEDVAKELKVMNIKDAVNELRIIPTSATTAELNEKRKIVIAMAVEALEKQMRNEDKYEKIVEVVKRCIEIAEKHRPKDINPGYGTAKGACYWIEKELRAALKL